MAIYTLDYINEASYKFGFDPKILNDDPYLRKFLPELRKAQKMIDDNDEVTYSKAKSRSTTALRLLNFALSLVPFINNLDNAIMGVDVISKKFR
jgi:hypothetical protein